MNLKTISKKKVEYKSGKLPAVLYQSELRKRKTGKNIYYAKVASRGSYNMDTIAEDLLCMNVLEGLTKEQILRVWELIEAGITERILNGGTVKCGLGSFYAKIIGEFENQHPKINRKKNYIDIGFTSNGKITKLASDEQIVPLFSSPKRTEPVIVKVEDYFSKTDSILTPGKLLSLEGHNLKLYEESDLEGIEFISISDENKSVFINLQSVITNEIKHIICIVPELEKGEYKIKLSTRYVKGRALKTARSYTTKKTFTVV